ncbi:protein SLOW GREEN 1, chloroplastic [Malania oleifera]|uniref:protein SLOW GREEN 1, chloroplastic n=1 Tax=Malania oleifera TaxID=397392 RepID=UPI0025AE1200|nr:protein SLOW GREEN 1, chloroplastic [Malania oleifera]
MDSALASSPLSLLRSRNSSSFLPNLPPPLQARSLSHLPFAIPKPSLSPPAPRLRISNAAAKNPIIRTVNSTARTLILTAAAALLVGKFPHAPARAQSPVTISEQTQVLDETAAATEEQSSPLESFLDSNSEAVDALKALLQQKLENGEDDEALNILRKLVSAQPAMTEWKFLMARLLNEMGSTEDARKVFEEILEANPLSFEALFENALLMDRCGEGEAVIKRLEEALKIAESENKAKEARDVKLIMAQIEFLQKNVEEALKRYEELAKEDPSDYRPYFCKGTIYSLTDRNEEARAEFAKYRELSPKKYEVEGFLQTPLSRVKLFRTDSKN